MPSEEQERPADMNTPASDPVLTTAEAVLARTFGGAVRLGGEEAQGGSDRSKVLRCAVLEGPEGCPATVIIKRAQGDEQHPYDPEKAENGSPAWRLFNDWAGLEFLTEAFDGVPDTPRFYGADRAAGLIVLEDIGNGESLADLLLGSDPDRAEAGLYALATALGRMHARTIGRADEFTRLRGSLSGGDFEDSRTATLSMGRDEILDPLTRTCEQVGVALPPAVTDEVQRVVAAIGEPGPFLAFTHGDPCPDNDRYVDGRLRLFDFEFGQFRHALIDGVYGRVPFPTCWCVNQLPSHIPPRMEAVYRAELVKGCPEAADDARFNAALVDACAYWVLRTTSWHLEGALKEEGRWGIATIRQRLLLRLDGLNGITAESGQREATGDFARRLATALRALWPPEADAMPLYPAFRREGAEPDLEKENV